MGVVIPEEILEHEDALEYLAMFNDSFSIRAGRKIISITKLIKNKGE